MKSAYASDIAATTSTSIARNQYPVGSGHKTLTISFDKIDFLKNMKKGMKRVSGTI